SDVCSSDLPGSVHTRGEPAARSKAGPKSPSKASISTAASSASAPTVVPAVSLKVPGRSKVTTTGPPSSGTSRGSPSKAKVTRVAAGSAPAGIAVTLWNPPCNEFVADVVAHRERVVTDERIISDALLAFEGRISDLPFEDQRSLLHLMLRQIRVNRLEPGKDRIPAGPHGWDTKIR